MTLRLFVKFSEFMDISSTVFFFYQHIFY